MATHLKTKKPYSTSELNSIYKNENEFKDFLHDLIFSQIKKMFELPFNETASNGNNCISEIFDPLMGIVKEYGLTNHEYNQRFAHPVYWLLNGELMEQSILNSKEEIKKRNGKDIYWRFKPEHLKGYNKKRDEYIDELTKGLLKDKKENDSYVYKYIHSNLKNEIDAREKQNI